MRLLNKLAGTLVGGLVGIVSGSLIGLGGGFVTAARMSEVGDDYLLGIRLLTGTLGALILGVPLSLITTPVGLVWGGYTGGVMGWQQGVIGGITAPVRRAMQLLGNNNTIRPFMAGSAQDPEAPATTARMTERLREPANNIPINLREYVNEISVRDEQREGKSNSDIYEALSEDEQRILEDYVDLISLSVMSVPVMLGERAYDLNELMKLPETVSGRNNPIGNEKFKLQDIQSAQAIDQKIQDAFSNIEILRMLKLQSSHIPDLIDSPKADISETQNPETRLRQK